MKSCNTNFSSFSSVFPGYFLVGYEYNLKSSVEKGHEFVEFFFRKPTKGFWVISG